MYVRTKRAARLRGLGDPVYGPPPPPNMLIDRDSGVVEVVKPDGTVQVSVPGQQADMRVRVEPITNTPAAGNAPNRGVPSNSFGQWMNQTTGGIKNAVLAGGGALLFVILAAAGRRR